MLQPEYTVPVDLEGAATISKELAAALLRALQYDGAYATVWVAAELRDIVRGGVDAAPYALAQFRMTPDEQVAVNAALRRFGSNLRFRRGRGKHGQG